jgi:MauM/NapG family ferredoxin protein
MERRSLIKYFVAGAIVGATSLPFFAQAAQKNTAKSRYLRPPGALSEDKFLANCIHCGKCGEVCPNRAINFFGLENGLASLDTPYIVPREQSCILCMKCGDVCPTGALKPIARELEDIVANVKMGHARVDKNLCLSYQGKTCGVCARACPLPDIAMSVGFLETPIVMDACVGCGLCERSCIQIPPSIRVIPNMERS